MTRPRRDDIKPMNAQAVMTSQLPSSRSSSGSGRSSTSADSHFQNGSGFTSDGRGSNGSSGNGVHKMLQFPGYRPPVASNQQGNTAPFSVTRAPVVLPTSERQAPTPSNSDRYHDKIVSSFVPDRTGPQSGSSLNRFPVGFGGWNPARLYESNVNGTPATSTETATSLTPRSDSVTSNLGLSLSSVEADSGLHSSSPKPETTRRYNQVQAYTSWVNAQLKKKPGRSCINDLASDMRDGTAFADLIEVVAHETLPDIIHSPQTTVEMALNIDKVIAFMTNRSIRMHKTRADDIVNGHVNSIMRLILALAAHYKPNSVRESRNVAMQASLASYAQSAAVKLSDARRDAATVVHRPRRPSPLLSDGDVTSILNNATYTIQKSSSQDFVAGHIDARYRSLAESYASLSKEHEALKAKYLTSVHSCEDAVADLKLLKKTVLLLQELLLKSETSNSEGSFDGVDSISQFSGRPIDADEASFLCSRLLHSEETTKDVKEELSKLRNDCLKRQGAETGLQQLVEDQQGVIRQHESDLIKANLANQLLEKTKVQLEYTLSEKDRQIAELSHELKLLRTNRKDADIGQVMQLNRCNSNESERSSYVTTDGVISSFSSSVAPVRGTGSQSTKLLCFYGQNSTPNVYIVNKRVTEVTLSDVQSACGRFGSNCRYLFHMRDINGGLVKKQISLSTAVVPSLEGAVTVWIDDD